MAELESTMHSVDGLSIHVLSLPAGGRGTGTSPALPPVVFLHGFSGCAANWAPVWAALRAAGLCERSLLAPDIIGHGKSDSPAEPERYRMEQVVRDLAVLLDRFGAPAVDLVGYSMGGRLALHFAAAFPGRVRRLVLESATAGIDDPAQREERVRQDRELAAWIEANGVEAFVARWEALPLFASQKRLPPEVQWAQRRQRLANVPHGLANSLRGMGTGAQSSLWPALAGLGVETLLVAGEEDEKFCAIARKMHALLPRSRLFIVGGAGHNVHLEAPDRFARAVASFLEHGAGETPRRLPASGPETAARTQRKDEAHAD